MALWINGKMMEATSIAAWAANEPHLTKQETEVYNLVLESGAVGIACHEIEALGWLHQTASARLRGLALKNVIKPSGVKVKTPSGRWAIKWVLAAIH